MRLRVPFIVSLVGVASPIAWSPASAVAAVVQVVPTDSDEDNIAKIEAALAGDEVVVAPGTYRFRLYLEGVGTEAQPITIRAEDPADRPVWDLDGDVVENWPGSYDAGDAGRSMWQIAGSYYVISGIVFQGGTDGGEGDSGGVRLKNSDHVAFHDCLFQHNDNGLQGAGTATTVEFCEFAENGLVGGAQGSHNLYIHGGDITVRYSYIHDANSGQNMHVRANEAVFEYNWIARPFSYMADMMPCTIEPCTGEQTMLLRGNVFIGGTPANDGQVFVMYNDQATAGMSFALTLVNNTIIGAGDGAALVHFANEDPGLNAAQSARLDNNVLVDVGAAVTIDDEGLGNWSLAGTNNWATDGTGTLDGLQNTMLGDDPGFVDAAALDFVPTDGSPLVGTGDATVDGAPDKEYYRDETLVMHWRARASANDVGAFESTTRSPPVGPYGDDPSGGTDGGESSAGSDDGGSIDGSGDETASASASADDGTVGGADDGPTEGSEGATTTAAADEDDSGCGCGASPRPRTTLGLVAIAVLACRSRRRRIPRSLSSSSATHSADDA